MASFIELTEKDTGNKFIGNVDLLQRVFINRNGDTCVVGWNNNGYFEVKETYDEVVEKINNRMFKILIKK
jgi:uncharacterized protein YlzI (FlbEa/FlbD family)